MTSPGSDSFTSTHALHGTLDQYALAVAQHVLGGDVPLDREETLSVLSKG